MTYLVVTCVMRSGVTLMGMDKKVGVEWPKGEEITELAYRSPGERSVQGKDKY